MSCLLTSMVSDEKSGVNLIKDSFYVWSHFPLAAFKILFVFVFQYFVMCPGIDHFEFILLTVFLLVLAFWIYKYFSLNLGSFSKNILGNFSLNYSFCPLFVLSFWTLYTCCYAWWCHTGLWDSWDLFFVFKYFLSVPQIGSSQYYFQVC